MTWRDNPAIVWQDDDEDRIELVGGFLAAVETDRCMGYESGIDVTAPVSVEERVEATERWLAALGLTADNIRELPHPIEVGGRVRTSEGFGEVLAGPWEAWGDSGPMVYAVRIDRVGIVTMTAESLTPVDPEPDPEPDPAEPEWVITRDPQEIAAAIDAGRTVQCQYHGGGARHGEWINVAETAEQYRTRVEAFNGPYRYEGPAIEAPVDRCTPDNRTCGHDENRCLKSVAGFRLVGGGPCDWWCFRPVGHGGDCIPCDPYLCGGHHNLHLRPEDR